MLPELNQIQAMCDHSEIICLSYVMPNLKNGGDQDDNDTKFKNDIDFKF